MGIKRTLRPGEDQIRRNIYDNVRMGVEQLKFHMPGNPAPIVFCAGGPSLKDHIEDIRRQQIEGAEVVCVGNAANLLTANGIKPNGHILMDGVERNKSFVVPIKDTRYFVASQCDPSVLKTLENHENVYIWHAAGPPGMKEILDKQYGDDYFMIPGGSYVSLRAITLLHILGYTWIHVYGLDSCLTEDEHHAYSQPNADGQPVEDVTVGDRDFKCTYWMLDQADQFIDSLKIGRFGKAQLAVHGDGLIAYMIESGNGPTWRL